MRIWNFQRNCLARREYPIYSEKTGVKIGSLIWLRGLKSTARTSIRRRVPLSAATPASFTADQEGAAASAIGGVEDSEGAASDDMI